MREVETVQPLASLPTFGRTVQFTPRTTWVQRINIPRRADHSGHEPQPLHDLTSKVDTTVDLDGFRVLGCGRPPAGHPGEQHRRQPYRRRRIVIEFGDHPGSAVDPHPQRALQRPGQFKRNPAAVGRPTELPDDVAEGRRDLGERVLGGRAGQHLIGRPDTDGIADVVLVHPAVEGTDPHEPAVSVRTHRRHGRLVPLVVVDRRQRPAPLPRDGPELLQHRAGRLIVQMPDPALVQHADLVVHVRQLRHITIRGRQRHTRQERLRADDVRDDVVRSPAWQIRLRIPLVVGQPREQFVDLVPTAEQSVEHLALIELNPQRMLAPPRARSGAATSRSRSDRPYCPPPSDKSLTCVASRILSLIARSSLWPWPAQMLLSLRGGNTGNDPPGACGTQLTSCPWRGGPTPGSPRAARPGAPYPDACPAPAYRGPARSLP